MYKNSRRKRPTNKLMKLYKNNDVNVYDNNCFRGRMIKKTHRDKLSINLAESMTLQNSRT